MKKDNNIRIKVVFGCVLLVAFVLVSKLYILQIVNGKEYLESAEKKYVKKVANVFNRGSISFTTKDGEKIDAATIQTGYTVSFNPTLISEPADVYNKLSFVLDVDEETFLTRFEKSGSHYAEVEKKINQETADKINSLKIKGVAVDKERWRFYPGKNLASNVVGFMGWKDEIYKGQYGLERQYDDLLNRDTDKNYENFFVEIFSGIGSAFKGQDKDGSIVTTIEPTVQSFVEKELQETQEKWNSKIIGAIVMDPSTGEIIAMATSPSFDLNNFKEVEDLSIFNNPLVEDVYEMGSIVKPLTMAIGLETKAVTAKTQYEDRGSLTMNGFTIRNYDKKARGVVTMQDVLNKSLNTGVAFVVNKVGNQTFVDYLKKLIGEKTEIDLPNEAHPLIENLKNNRDIEYVSASYGQGIAMSPISITRALATLGNGGYLVTPHIVSEIKYENGEVKKTKVEKGERIFSQDTSEEISRMLTHVVDDALAGGEVALPNHSIAAKTGTAQIAVKGGKGYYEDRFLHSFFGYFPSFNPRFIVFMYHTEPHGADYSSQTLTEPFMDITKFLINYYDIPPDRQLDDERNI
ncbi:MAG: penicillin-binding protein 2 [Candidatus Pacebacteria bacterium]|nr:penicillin-binding protein 2 [Candidatus Paceibacterota bacterium]